MLRSFKRRLHIGLHPDRVVLSSSVGIWRRRESDSLAQPVLAKPGSMPCQQVLDVLETTLADSRWHRFGARVLLSNALVRYTVVPSSPLISNLNEEAALARLKFQQIHGSASGEAEIRLANALSGESQLAASLDPVFNDRLKELCGAAQIRLLSVEPALMRAFNCSARSLRGEKFWFLHAERALVTAARFENGACVGVNTLPLEGALSRTLKDVLDTLELMESCTSVAPLVYLHAPGIALDGCDPGPERVLIDLSARREGAHFGSRAAAENLSGALS